MGVCEVIERVEQQKQLEKADRGYEETTILYLNNGTSVMTNPKFELDEGFRAGLEAVEEMRRRSIIRHIMNRYRK